MGSIYKYVYIYVYIYVYMYIYIALSFNRSLYIHLLYITLYNHTWSLCHKLPTIMYQVIIYIYSFKQNLVSWYPVIFLVVRTWENTVHNKKLTLLFLVQSTRRVSKSARVLGHCSTSLKTPPSEQEFSSIFTRLESDDPQDDDHGQSRMIDMADMVIINRAFFNNQ